MSTKRINFWMALMAAAGMAACDGSAIAPGGGARVSLSLTTGSSAAVSAAVRAALVPAADSSGRKLDIQRVQLVLKEVELKRQADSTCLPRSHGCTEFEAGPVLITLPLTGGVITPFNETVAPGVYDALELKVHEPDDSNGDRTAFYAAHPDWQRKATVRVTGTYDAGTGTGAQPFDVFLNANVEVERDLSPPLTVDATTAPASINLTLGVDVDSWFRTAGGALIDPRSTVNDRQALKLVTENVKRSFRAMRDDDRNGDDDHDDHGRHGGDDSGRGRDDKGSGGRGSDDKGGGRG